MKQPSDAPSQIKRFRDAALELGADESEQSFDQVLRKVGKAQPAPMHKPGADNGSKKAGRAKATRKAK
jgi:hypothetical protein